MTPLTKEKDITYTLIQAMSVELLHKVSKRWRKDNPNLMFMVSREPDDVVYLYKALRTNDRLEAPYGLVSRAQLSSHKETPVPELLLKNFFGMDITPTVDQGRYRMTVRALPERVMELELRRKNNRVAVYVDLTENKEKVRCELVAIHMDMSFNAVNYPDLRALVVHGIATDSAGTRRYVTERVKVTPAMRSRFDTSKLFQDWMRNPLQ